MTVLSEYWIYAGPDLYRRPIF